MADPIVSVVAERIIGLLEEQARYHINLVRGAEKEIRKLAENLETVRMVLDDAENRRFSDKMINRWLSKLERTSYQMEDVLDEWNYALLKLQMESDDIKQKVCSFIPSSSCLSFKKVAVRHGIAKKIIDVKEKLDEILKEKNQYKLVTSEPTTYRPLPESWRTQSTSSIDFEKVHGRDRDRDFLVSKLVGCGGSKLEDSGFQILSIVGVGGLGKTTLSQLVYNDSRVEKYFDLKIWVCVSDPFEVGTIARGIIESVRRGSSPNTTQLDILLQDVKESVSGKKFLLILDDVWTEDENKWEPLKLSLRSGGEGSKVLVTTRNKRVAKTMGVGDNDIHHPRELSRDDCWLILHSIALSSKNSVEFKEFEAIGRKIAEKCNGLPLAAKTLGSLLRFKNTLEEWEKVLDSEIWQLEKVEIDVFPHLLLSYNELSPAVRRCFSYCAVFPKDSWIHVDALIEYWRALGYLGAKDEMEDLGQEYFDILAMHSLFQDFEKDVRGEKIIRCKMHDIVHDFAQFLRKSGRVEVDETNETICGTCNRKSSVSAHLNEFCSLLRETNEAPPYLCHCVARLRVFGYDNVRGRQGLPQRMVDLIHLRWFSVFGYATFSPQDLQIIFKLYNLQTLILSISWLEEIPSEIGNLIHLRNLYLSHFERLRELPREVGKLVELRRLDLYNNASLVRLPKEIGNLIHLKHLNLMFNRACQEFPMEIWSLIQLRYLNLKGNSLLKELPREVGNLIHLRELDLTLNKSLENIPSEIANLVCLRNLSLRQIKCKNESPESIGDMHELRTLNAVTDGDLDFNTYLLDSFLNVRIMNQFVGGRGMSRLGLLENINHLIGSLRLHIVVGASCLEEEVEEARKAGLRNKQIEGLEVFFSYKMDEDEDEERRSSVGMDVLDALEPNPKLRYLKIKGYLGSQLPLGWIVSPLNQLRKVCLCDSLCLTSLPPLGKLQFLEQINIENMQRLRFVGREFMSSSSSIAFPQLIYLTFRNCGNWNEWEDITAEEEESEGVVILPRLTSLVIECCEDLRGLPHRLLRKAAALQVLDIFKSRVLEQRYIDKDGSSWKSISHSNQDLQLHAFGFQR